MSLTKAYLRQAMDIEIDTNDEAEAPENHLTFVSTEALEKFHRQASYNTWRWCTVRVEVYFGPFIGVDTLGCCSFKSEEDFESSSCYEDMVLVALDDLHKQVTTNLFVFTYNDSQEGK